MNRPIYYCRTWFRAKKRPTEVWSEDQARSAHTKKLHYTVLVDSIERPYCFLDIADKVVGVGFLDLLLRESLTYAFQEVQPGVLFLTMATHREFEGDTDNVTTATSYMFDRSGGIKVRRQSLGPHQIETSELSSDISSNYASAPEFGQYDDLIRIERI
jgi:hypothetical protein